MGRRQEFPSGPPSALRTALPPLLLVAFVVLRYHSITSLFWMIDDTQILKHAIVYRPWQHLFDPDAWQIFSAVNFTPWLPLSFLLDWKLFGLNPSGFYYHQLISLCLTAASAYLVFRLWLSEWLSFLGVLLFFASPPVADSAQLLMVRHYIEGLLFSLLSVYLFVKGLRENRFVFAMAGALFYLMAILSKEIYVPLVCILLIIPEKTFAQRLRYASFPIAFVILYVFLRQMMIGHLAGGYGDAHNWTHDLVFFFPRVAAAITGDAGAFLTPRKLLIALSSFTALFLLYRADRKSILSILLFAPLFFLPILPVSASMSARYVLLIVFGWITMHLFAWKHLLRKPSSLTPPFIVVSWSALLLAVFLSTSLSQPFWKNETADRYRAEGQFLLYEGTSSDLLIDPVALSYGHYYEGLEWLRKNVLALPEGPAVTADPAVVCSDTRSPEAASPPVRFKRVWRAEDKKIAEVSDNFDVFCTRFSPALTRQNIPLQVSIQYADSLIRWQLGPYGHGRYSMLFGRLANDALDLPQTGQRRVFLKNRRTEFRIRYRSPEGWLAYSPLLELNVDDTDKGAVIWQR